MKIKYVYFKHNPHSSGCAGINPETQIKYIDENSISIDGEVFSFDPNCVSWPKIAQDTNGVIFSATRDTELHLAIRMTYQSSCPAGNTGVEGAFNASS